MAKRGEEFRPDFKELLLQIRRHDNRAMHVRGAEDLDGAAHLIAAAFKNGLSDPDFLRAAADWLIVSTGGSTYTLDTWEPAACELYVNSPEKEAEAREFRLGQVAARAAKRDRRFQAALALAKG